MFLLFIILLVFFQPDSIQQNHIPKTLEKGIEKELEAYFNADNFDLKWLNAVDPSSLYRLEVDSIFQGFVLLTSSMGRFEEFQYMILYNSDVVVQKVKILQYKSSHGNGVTSKRWLKQFIGQNGETLKYGKDIQAISGATYSATSLTNDVPAITRWVKQQIDQFN
ncbi:MAG: FMN-binding protein [Prolixibacteraceae bacterium]